MSRALLRLCFLLLSACAAYALDLNSLKPQGYVSDFANVLDADTRAKIEDYCGRVEQATGVQIAVVTVMTLDGAPIEDAANTLYRKWGIGKKGKDEGVLLLVAIQDHKDRVEVGYGLEPVLPDGFAGSVLREATPLLRAQQYGQAMLAAAEEIGSRVAKAKGVTLDFSLFPARRERRAPASPFGSIPWPLIFIGLIILLSLFGRGRRGGGGGGGGFLTGMILGNMLGGGRGGGGWGGGGFGGYDSGGGGGGFGGFGGGDSGGGGASGSW